LEFTGDKGFWCASGRLFPTSVTTVSEEKRPWHLSPLVGAKLGSLGLLQRTPVSVSPKVKDLVRKLSESVKKQGILSRFSEKKGSSS
jgi:hypothetical protein